jgi:hypothetical protein
MPSTCTICGSRAPARIPDDREREGDQEQPVEREVADAEIDRAPQLRRRSEGQAGEPEGDAHALDHAVGQAEGEEQRIVDAAPVERAHQHPLDGEPEEPHRQRGGDQAEPEAAGIAVEKDPDIGADHEEGAVGEVDDVHQPEDQRQADADEDVDRPERDAGHELQREQVEGEAADAEVGHGSALPAAGRRIPLMPCGRVRRSRAGSARRGPRCPGS